jgi:hypothetical protein
MGSGAPGAAQQKQIKVRGSDKQMVEARYESLRESGKSEKLALEMCELEFGERPVYTDEDHVNWLSVEQRQ